MLKLGSNFKCASALIALTAASAAWAQEAPQVPQDEAEESRLNEIVVTAQFIDQSAQDIPIAVTAISGELLDTRGQDSVALIGAQAPNVQLQQAPSGQGNALTAFIRGVGQQDNSPALEPGVGIYIDDVYFPTVQGAQFDLLDLERVEILRGPQGTLAGKNSIGGSIKLFSKSPDDDPDGYFEVSGGSFDALRIRGGTNFTLIDDQLYARISGVFNRRDGYVDLVDFGCQFPASGLPSATTDPECETGSLGGIKTTAGRFALRWDASSTFELNFSADIIRDRSEPAASIATLTGPTLAPVFAGPPAGPGLPPPLAFPWINPGPAADPSLPPTDLVPILPAALNPCVFVTLGSSPGACPDLQASLGGAAITDGFTSFATFTNAPSGFAVAQQSNNDAMNFTLRANWDLSDQVELVSISALREYDIVFASDDDNTPFGVSTQSNTQELSSFSQELRLNTQLSDRVTATFGGFYQDTSIDIGGQVQLGYAGLEFLIDDRLESTSWALFANTIVELSDSFQIAGGLRYSSDDKSFLGRRLNPDGTSPIACAIIDVAPGVSIVNPGSSPNCLVGGLNDTPAQVFEDTRLDYRLALSFFPNDDTNLYASVSTGYKAGGVNARPFFAQQQIPHNPEEVTSFEVGVKTDLLDNTLRFNAAAFYNDYSDVIVTLFECTAFTGPPFGSPCFLPINAGEADVKGVEFELDWAPTPELTIDGSFSYIDFEYTDTNGTLPLTTQQPFTPEVTWSLGAQYEVNTGFGSIIPRVDVVYQDDMFSTPANSPFDLIEARTLVNAAIRWTSKDENWLVGLEVRNLTDEYYLAQQVDFTGGANGFAYGTPGLPRTFVVSLRRNF